MVMIASNETAESLQGQQLMEASWVVLKTSLPSAWASGHYLAIIFDNFPTNFAHFLFYSVQMAILPFQYFPYHMSSCLFTILNHNFIVSLLFWIT